MPGNASTTASGTVPRPWFAAPVIATGEVIGLCEDRRRHREFPVFLKYFVRVYPDDELHLVMGDYATYKKVEVRDWFMHHPRITVYFTSTAGSWLNMVEVWFGIVECQLIRRGTFTSVQDLMARIRAFINGWNRGKHPFMWTKPPDWASVDGPGVVGVLVGFWSIVV